MTAQGFDDAIVAYRNGAPIRIRDIGRAIEAPVDTTLGGWLNGKPAVLLSVFRQPGANVTSAVAAIKKALPQLRASLPPGIDVEIVSDRTQTIAASLADVRFTLLLTIALVVGVIALFLRKLWATVIPAISVPISLIGTFAVMYALGYSLDNLSLMALTIAVGFVVDDAIVMVENIVRHMEGGASPLQAALDGAGEIGFTILSISISLIAVFIPLFLMGGVVGLLFREFAVTVAVSILVSVLVSLTLTPMLCAKLLLRAGHEKEGRISGALEVFFTWLVHVDDRALIVALRHRRATLAVGNLIQPTNTTGIVVLTQVQPISVVFILPNADIASVQEAMARGPVQATVYDQSGSKQLDVGTLLAINNQAAPTSGTVQLKAIFPNQQRQLWPGTFVNVDLTTSVVKNALTVPTNALQQNDNGQFVYVVGADKRVSVRPVEVAQRLHGVALISKGLQAGETVVVQGQYRLTPGTLVAAAAPSETPNPSTASSGMLP